jgi:hypothetical protein
MVYNFPTWRFGFSTGIPLDAEYDRAVSYVLKYLTKAGEKIGGRWYYSGGKIPRPVVALSDLEIRDVENLDGAYRFDVPEAGVCFCKVCMSLDEFRRFSHGCEDTN